MVGQATKHLALSDVPRALQMKQLGIAPLISFSCISKGPWLARQPNIWHYLMYPVHSPPSSKSAPLANREFCSGEYYVRNLLKSWFAKGLEPVTGIKPGTTLLLAFANTTKP
jgi:hypothetical protein